MSVFKKFKISFNLGHSKNIADEIPDIVNKEGEYRLYKAESLAYGLDGKQNVQETSSSISPSKTVRIDVPIRPSKSTEDLTKLNADDSENNDSASNREETLETLTTHSVASSAYSSIVKPTKQEEKQRKKLEKQEKVAQKKREKEEKAAKKERDKQLKKEKAKSKNKGGNENKQADSNNSLVRNVDQMTELSIDSIAGSSGPPPYSQPESMTSFMQPSSSRDN